MQLLRLPFTAQCALALLALLATTTVEIAAQSCQPRPRREFRDLSSGEWQAVVSSMQNIQRTGEYDALVLIHSQNHRTVHSTPNFLPWHRYYILRLEQALQSVDSSVMLPYWNWAYDSQAPEASLLFTDAYLGGNGQGDGRCVRDGQFRDWRPANPRPHCLTRNWDLGDRISSFYGVEVINRIVTDSRVYETFRTGLEGAPHGAVHNNIGSDFSTMASPNDPIFWLHHAYVDKIWADWQRQHPTLANTYGGTNRDGTPARLTDNLVTSDYTVGAVMNTRDLCYYYAELANTSGPATPTTPANPSTPSEPVVPDQPTRPGNNNNNNNNGDQNENGGRLSERERRRRQRQRQRQLQNQPPLFGGRLRKRYDLADMVAGYGEEMPNKFSGGPLLAPVAGAIKGMLYPSDDTPCDADEEPVVTTTPYTGTTKARRVSPGDRSDLMAIRTPKPLPTAWIDMQGMNVTEFRQQETKLSEVCALVNAVEGYASPAALFNRRDILSKLTAKLDRFYAIVDGLNTTVTGFTVPDVLTERVRTPLLRAPLRAAQNTLQSLEQVIGKVVYPEVTSVLPVATSVNQTCSDD